jgi:ribokinase
MNNLLVVGTVALDDIETPFGKVDSVLGGAGAYAALAASYFADPALVSIIGRDMPKKELARLSKRKISLDGLEYGEKSFHWSGYYEFDMNAAKTRKTELNVLAEFNPKLSPQQKKSRFLLLANCDPSVQLQVIKQMDGKPFIAVDTMNYWIETKKEELLKVIRKANLVVMNEGEARLLFGTPNLIKAGRELLALGPKYAIIKKGEHGALLFSEHNYFSAAGYPLESLKDPTGAGDSFLGGLMGYLVKQLDSQTAKQSVSEEQMRKAVVYGSVIASFCAEEFGTGYIDSIKISDIHERYGAIQKICQF